MTQPQPPGPLGAKSLALLAEHRARRGMPAEARERVSRRLQLADKGSAIPAATPAWRWVAVGGALAAAVVAALVVSGDRNGARQLDPRPSEAQLESQASGTEGVARPVTPTSARVRVPPAEAPTAPDEALPLDQPPPDVAPPDDPHRGAASPPETTRKAPPARARPKPATTSQSDTPAPAVSTLGDENRMISAAWRHVTAKDFDKAQDVIAEHAERFPAGVLAPERRALRVIVDCLDASAGQSAADAFATRHPRSPLLKKVREACDATKETPPEK